MSAIITLRQSFCVIVRRHTLWTYAAIQNGRQALHIIVEKVIELLVSL